MNIQNVVDISLTSSEAERYRPDPAKVLKGDPEQAVFHQYESPCGQMGVGVWEGAVYGELDGVYAVSGFNNNVENVLQVGGTYVDPAGLSIVDHVAAILAAAGRAFVVLQDVNQTDWRSFIALEMT